MELDLTRGKGEFFCPVCRLPSTYKLKKRKQFVTLYFIPLIPINDVDTFIRCDRCRNKFGEEIPTLMAGAELAVPNESDRPEDITLRLMVLAMIADGTVDDRELQMVQTVYSELFGQPIGLSEIRQTAAAADRMHLALSAYAALYANRLSIDEKHAAIRAIFLVASATGQLSKEQEAQLGLLPEALDVPEGVFRNLVNEAAIDGLA